MSHAAESPNPERSREVFRVDPAFTAILARHHLTDCESLVASEGGTALRRLPTRENWRLDLANDDGHITTLYLKKHRVRSLSTRIRAFLGRPSPATPARVEAERTRQIAAAGIPTMTVAAYAEQLRRDGTLISAFLTEELTGYEQLDLFLPKRFSTRSDANLRILIEQVAVVARRFHRLGFNHRDFYTCHFFIRERETSEFAVSLIDLQRVQRWPLWLRRRWIIKDLAQLAYSCPRHHIGPAERLRFFKWYLDLPKLDRRGKRLARAVLKREAALRRKHGPYRPEWEADPPIDPPRETDLRQRVA